MITPQEATTIIDEFGIKRKVFARRARIHPITFSEWANGRRILTQDQMVRIEVELDKLKTILT